MSRVLRQWTPEDDEVLEPEAVRLAALTYRIGVAHFPEDVYMFICYSNFLISVQCQYQVWVALIHSAPAQRDGSAGCYIHRQPYCP